MDSTVRPRYGLPLALIFCLSGASALAYQVIWVRQLTFSLGGSAIAVSTILATFMAGLGIGAWIGGRIADQLRRPLLGYSVAEVLIAACALATPVLLSTSGALYLSLHQAFGASPVLATLSRAIAAAVILIVPTTLMGATLPFMVRFYVRGIDHLGRGLGLLYGINIVGGVLGAAYAGFYSIHVHGVHHTLLVAVAVNLIAAASAFALTMLTRGRVEADRWTEAQTGVERPAFMVHDPERERLLPLLFVGFAASGFTGLAYEVLWTRALSFAIGNSVYAFTTVLVVTLTGLCIGSFLAGFFADRSRAPLRVVGIVQALGGLTMLLTFSQAGRLPRLTKVLVDKMGAGTMTDDVITKVVPASLALLVPMILLGFTFPFLMKTATTRMEGLGRRLGAGYAVNTAGAIAGSLIAGYVLLPVLGMVRGMLLVAIVNLAVAAAFLLRSEGRRPRLVLSSGALAAAVAVLVVLATIEPQPFIRNVRGIMRGSHSEIIFCEEGRSATVTVIRKADAAGNEINLSLYINLLGAAVTGPASQHEQYYSMIALLPAVLHPSPKTVFVAGVASGVSTGAAAIDERTERVVSVEISPEVIRAARLFEAYNYGAMNHPRIEVIADDARAWLATTRERFDIIVTDCFISAITGTAALYSREYFELCRTRLAPGGYMSVGVDRLSGTDRVVARTFLEAFPYTALFVSPDRTAYNRAFLIGSNEPIAFSREVIEDAYSQRYLARELARYKFTAPENLYAAYLCGRDDLFANVDDAEICTDDRPVIDFHAVAWAEGFVAAREGRWERDKRTKELIGSAPRVGLAELAAMRAQQPASDARPKTPADPIQALARELGGPQPFPFRDPIEATKR